MDSAVLENENQQLTSRAANPLSSASYLTFDNLIQQQKFYSLQPQFKYTNAHSFICSPHQNMTQNNFNSSRTSKIQELNYKITKDTGDFVNKKTSEFKFVENFRHKDLKPEKINEAGFQFQRQRDQGISLQIASNPKNQLKSQPFNFKSAENKTLKNKIRKNPVTINFLYNNPRRNLDPQCISNHLKIPSFSSTYQSTDLVLTQQKDFMKLSPLNKKQIHFSYRNQGLDNKNDKIKKSESDNLLMRGQDRSNFSWQQADQMKKRASEQNFDLWLGFDSNKFYNHELQSISFAKQKNAINSIEDLLLKRTKNRKNSNFLKLSQHGNNSVLKQKKLCSFFSHLINRLRQQQSKLTSVFLITLAMLAFLLQLCC